MKLSECNGSETRIDECNNTMNEGVCHPVLVDCGSSSSSSSGGSSGAIAAGVTIPLLLLLIGGVSGTIITVFIIWKKAKAKPKTNDR